MATNRVTASLTVSFGEASASAAGNGLVLEIDDRDPADGGLNAKGSSFVHGDTAYYLLYTADNVTVTQHLVTAGSKSGAGSGSRTLTGTQAEMLTFTDSNSATLRYPASGVVTMTWQGRERTDGLTGSITTTLGDDQMTVTLNGTVCGVLKCEYSASYQAFALKNVPKDYTDVLVFVAGTRA